MTNKELKVIGRAIQMLLKAGMMKEVQELADIMADDEKKEEKE